MATPSERAILTQIRTQPYYSVRYQPVSVANVPIARLRELLQSNAVSLRGWSFPHYDAKSTVPAQTYIYGSTDWERHVELWRMYRSGQFVYFGAPWDLAMDHQDRLRYEFDHNVFSTSDAQKASVVGLLSLVGIIYSVTEFYIFVARLAKSLQQDRGAVEVALKHVEGWALVAGEPGTPWHGFYQCRIPDIRIKHASIKDLLNDPLSVAADTLRELFESFSWDNAEGAIKSWQERLMAGRFVF